MMHQKSMVAALRQKEDTFVQSQDINLKSTLRKALF